MSGPFFYESMIQFGMVPAFLIQRKQGYRMNQNRIKLIALITSIFFIVLAEINHRTNGLILAERSSPYGLRMKQR
jgi:hypothetical protein